MKKKDKPKIFQERSWLSSATDAGCGGGDRGTGVESFTNSDLPKPVVHLSLLFLIVTAVLASTLAFFAGTICRVYILEPRVSGLVSVPTNVDWYTGIAFPFWIPENAKGREAIGENHNLHKATADEEAGAGEQRHQDQQAAGATTDDVQIEHDSSSGEDGEDSVPAGEHLLVNIKNVDSNFLSSEQRLIEAMIKATSFSHLTLRSYHCHSLVPNGVSCVGILLKSHFSFYTWPGKGVIALDLFFNGSGKKLVPMVPLIERLFAIPQESAGKYRPPLGTAGKMYVAREEDYVENPFMIWSHISRGFRPKIISEEGRRQWRVLENDVTEYALGQFEMEYKKVITSTVTPYQQIDVVEVINPRLQTMKGYERSLRPEVPTYESAHPELFRPNRLLFLDGVVQSTLRGVEAYHEALVHPAMFAHKCPKKVAIIGGGEGSTLREVLKHSTVETVKMIEIDEMMVNASREFLPSWNDCSDLRGSADSCFDNPRTDLACEDALAWFIDRYGEGEDGSDDDEEEDSSDDDEEDSSDDNDEREGELDIFDVIIMDALDPQDSIEFADALYNNEAFVGALHESLSEDGIIVMQLGESPERLDPSEELSVDKNRAATISLIEGMGFQSMHVYEEGHCGFQFPWSFLVACKSFDCRVNWFANEALIETEIHNRIKRTRSGKPSLKYFDGATMRSYNVPPKEWEIVYCRKDPAPADCAKYRGFDKSVVNYDAEQFEVQMSSTGGGTGWGTFARVDVPKGSYIMQEQAPARVHFAHSTYALMKKLQGTCMEANGLKAATQFVYGYGFQHKLVDIEGYYADSGAMNFVHRGRDASSNFEREVIVSRDGPFGEAELDPTKVADLNPANRSATLNPVVDRNIQRLAPGSGVTVQDIKAGEEVLHMHLHLSSGAAPRSAGETNENEMNETNK